MSALATQQASPGGPTPDDGHHGTTALASGRRPGQSPPPRGRSGGRARAVVARTAFAATLLGTLLLGFVVFLLAVSALQEQHFQSTEHRTFANELENAIAPVGAAPDGTPVAVLSIPAIGLRDAVVVEGTTARDLMRGPGHRRDTALPGQTGAAVVFGRRTSFGGPFAHLDAVRVGDAVDVTTGQGRFTYVVDGLGTGAHPVVSDASARLILATGNSSWIPTGTVLVSSHLEGSAAVNPGGRPAQVPADKAMAGEPDAVAPLQLWMLALCGATALAVIAALRWRRSAAYLVFAPVLTALVWCVYENAAALLPNLY